MKSVHLGHRARMRERYRAGGERAMQTHELLEMLLYHAVAQRDVNPLSHALLERFGSLDGVFSATKEELIGVSGVGDRVAELILQSGRASLAMLNAPLWEKKPPAFDDYCALGEHFVSYFESHPSQATVAMLLDARLCCLSLFELAPLDFGSAGVRADSLIGRGIALGATVVALAHNHPHGPAYPSHSDVVSAQVFSQALSDSGFFLLEHYVISGRDYVGFRHHFCVQEGASAPICAFLSSKERVVQNDG